MTDPVYTHPNNFDFLYSPPSPPLPSFAHRGNLLATPPGYSDSPGPDVPAYGLPPSPPAQDVVEAVSSLPPGLPPAISALNVQERKKAKRGVLASLHGLATGSSAVDEDAIEIVLTEALVFLVPPRVGESTQRFFDAGVEGDGSGKDGRINGFVHVLSHESKHVDSISVKLKGFTRILGNAQGVRASDPEVFLERELFVSGSNEPENQIWLEQGVNTFEFSFTLAATSPTSERTPSAICQYHVSAHVSGTGARTSTVQTSREVIVVCNPHRESNVLQYQHHHEVLSKIFGPYALDLAADQFILSAPFRVTLTLAAPPPHLTIFSLNSYMRQTTTLLPTNGPPIEVHSSRKYIVREGELGQCGLPGWAARARSGKGVAGGTGIILDNRRERASDAGFWRWTKVARLPNDNTMRASTLPGTVSPLRFSTVLVVEIVFNEESADPQHDGKVKFATLFEKEVHISSCCCWLPYLALPTYSPDTPEETRFKWHINGCVGCMCDELWESVERDEVELMRGGQTDELSGDGLIARRPINGTRKALHTLPNGSSHVH